MAALTSTILPAALGAVTTVNQIRAGLSDGGPGPAHEAELARREQAIREARIAAEQQFLDWRRLDREQAENLRAARNSTASEARDRRAAASDAEAERLASLTRERATARASAAGRGIGGSGGSQAAILRGLLDQSEGQRATRARVDAAKAKAATDGLAALQRANLLEREALRERHALERLTWQV